ncbi:unnamed protein product [Amaranthus hypochondriacus]
MTPVIPCSVSNISFIHGNVFTTRKGKLITRYNSSGNPTRLLLSSQKVFVAFPHSNAVFQQLRNGCSRIQRLLATGTDVAVEEQGSSVADEASAGPGEGETNEEPSAKADVSAAPQAKRRQGRKSEMPPVKKEELVPGAMFTGKVRSILPFGAFVDFGAFTDGLVHVSMLSDSFVKDVNDVVSVGQEVKVRLVEVNDETGRISLSMRDDDSSNKPQPKRDGSGEKSREPRRGGPNKGSQKRGDVKKTKFVLGQDLVGTVKNFARSGAFISLPEGEEGFLPTSEEPDDGFANVMGNTSLEVGQEVNVRVLRITRGTVTLTMKKDEDKQTVDTTLNQGVVHTATNPFVMAFRRNKDIAAFLDVREKAEEEVSADIATSDISAETTTADDVSADATTVNDVSTETQAEILDVKEDASVEIPVDEAKVEASAPEGDQNISASSAEEEVATPTSLESSVENEEVKSEASPPSQEVVAETQAEEASPEEVSPVEIPTEAASVETTPAGNGSINGSTAGENGSSPQGSTSKATIAPSLVKQLRDETGAGMMDCKKALSETGGDIVKAQEYLRKKGLASADKKASRTTAEGRIGAYIHDSRIGILIEVNCETDFVARGEIFRELVDDLAMQVAACPQVEYLSTDDVPKELVDKETEIEMQKEDLLSKPEQIRSKIVEGRVNKRLGDLALLEQPYIKDDKVAVKDWVKQTIATIGENIKVNRFVRYNLGEGLEKKSENFAAEVAAQTAAKAAPAPEKEQVAADETAKPAEKAPTVAVSAALVKQLREETGAGMMDCKKALAETGGDLEKAQEYLRKKGLSSAEKKSSRLAAEGRIGSYIHDARIGVLIEVNCETDFVGRSENFKELVDDLAMQVAACPQVDYVSIDDIPESIVSKEKEIEMQREDILSKPENIREKIVEGRISKRLGELALLEQPFIKDDKLLVKDLVKQTVAALGENIKVRRFTRFTLGEKTETSNTEQSEA